MIQRHYAMMYEQQVQPWGKDMVAGFSGENALGLAMDGTSVNMNGRPHGTVGQESDGDDGGCLTPPPAYGPPIQSPLPTIVGPLSIMGKLMSTGFGSGFGQNTPTLSILSTGCPSDATDPIVSAPPTPTPTRATFVVAETKTRTTRTTTTKTERVATDPATPMHALVEVHRAQDSVDAAADEVTLRGTLASVLDAHNDVAMVRCLQVARGEIPEAAETLRRMLNTEMGEYGNEPIALERGQHGVDMGNTELDRKFMQSGIEAMARLTSAVMEQPWGEAEQVGLGEGTGVVGAPELPSWTITRYVTVIPALALVDAHTYA